MLQLYSDKEKLSAQIFISQAHFSIKDFSEDISLYMCLSNDIVGYAISGIILKLQFNGSKKIQSLNTLNIKPLLNEIFQIQILLLITEPSLLWICVSE